MIVIIADRSQINRLGIKSVLRQLNSPIHIREISVPAKLFDASYKSSSQLLVISASFPGISNKPISETIDFLLNFPSKILIHDQEIDADVVHAFNEVIEPDDNEKSIIQKIERQVTTMMQQHALDNQDKDLSHREKDVLRLVAMGHTNKEIAEKLFISTHTVITHRKNITAKLGIKTIAGLTVYAVINKLIALDDIQQH